jgi:hypothetical protein
VVPWIHAHDYTVMVYEEKLRGAQEAHDRFDPLWESMRAWALPNHYHRARTALLAAVSALLRATSA